MSAGTTERLKASDTLLDTLHPRRFPGMSGKMAAIVAYILNREAMTKPAIADIVVTSDGFVMAQHEGDVGHNDFIGAESDFVRNWKRMLDLTAEAKVKTLTAELRAEAEALYKQAIRRA